MVRVVTLSAEDDFDGWRSAARGLAATKVPAGDVVWQVGEERTDLFATDQPANDPSSAVFSVPREFVSMARQAILHRNAERFALLYSLLLRVVAQPNILNDRSDRQLRRVEEFCQAIRRDMHKMRAFVRFRELEADGEKRLVAWFEPEHHILRANTAFFVNRFTNMNWSILTPMASIHWDGHVVTEGPGASREDAPSDDPVEHIWKTYFRSIFNPARLATDAMKKEMPKKYWKNMPETALLPEMIAGARARELEMIEQARTSSRQRHGGSWNALRDEASDCRRCPLWRPATQTVFGDGPATATMMIVGEQPGDSEDSAGKPFVGPAGEVFDRALKEAGIYRDDTYVTNAVKHFKFEPRGKRRIHARPNVGEIEACRWWLDQELAIVRPKMVIAMGASAARSLLGRPVTISADRGKPLVLNGGAICWVTVHPSFILRAADASQEQFAEFVQDLRRAKSYLEALAADGGS